MALRLNQVVDRLAALIARHDPASHALHKALQNAAVVPVALAIGMTLGGPAFSVFAVFGSVSMLLFADFPGDRTARAAAYAGLTGIGAFLVALGTAVSTSAWLAVSTMAVVGFVVWFSGIVSAEFAGGTKAALLAFVLGVTVPGGLDQVGARLGGWGLAAALSVPVALYVWPPHEHDRLRSQAADLCDALAARLDHPDASDVDARMEASLVELRHQFHSTTARPTGPTTGGRLLLGLVDRLEWVHSVAIRIPKDARGQWPEEAIRLQDDASEVLRACARVLRDADPHNRAELTDSVHTVDRHRAEPALLQRVLEDPDGAAEGWSLLHELAYGARLVGEVVGAAAAADGRPLRDRLLGRGIGTGPYRPGGSGRVAVRHLSLRSVWFRNSARAAAGLALAVGLVEILEPQHGFWVVLGTLSVLRTTAIATGASALRALVGTGLGFAVGFALLEALGTEPWHLWLALPFTVFVAAYLPEVVSFVAGQAGFTVWIVVQFNLIDPDGWTVGLVRIEDVALGCVVGLASGFLLWPHGAAGRMVGAVGDAVATAAAAFSAAARHLVGAVPSGQSTVAEVEAARAAAARLDDALRQFLAEGADQRLPLHELLPVSNTAARILLTAETMSEIESRNLIPPTPATEAGPSMSSPPSTALDEALEAARNELERALADVTSWYEALAACLSDNSSTPPGPRHVAAEASVVAVLVPGSVGPILANVSRARRLWTAALYCDDLARLEAMVLEPALAVREAAPASV